MALRIALVVQTEFLRLVLRQLLRRQVGTEIIAEAADLGAAGALPAVGCLIIERSLCEGEGRSLAAILGRHRGQAILVGEGEIVTVPAGVKPGDVTLVPAGHPGAKLDPAALGERLALAMARPVVTAAVKASVTDTPPARPRRAQRPALVGIAVSTGGPETLPVLLKSLDPPVCPVIIALHSPEEHAASLAHHLAEVSGHTVIVGEAGPLPPRGIIFLPGGLDHGLVATTHGLSLRRVRGGTSNFHPNGDILLSSMAGLDCPVVGVILTGMGNDGCEGAKALKARSYPVLAQSPASCIVAGMPSAAIAAGAVSETAPPEGIALRLNDWFALPES